MKGEQHSSDEEDIPEAEEGEDEQKQKGSGKCLGITILIFIVVLLVLKWQEDKFRRSGAPVTDDLYDTLGIDSTATASAIKQKFRALSKSLHPDRNPNCEDCAARFNRVVEAYEILSDAERRDAYDNSYSRGKKITSHTHQVTTINYPRLIAPSFDFWVLQVYRDGDEYCEKFGPVWEQVASDMEGLVRFGRINAEKDPDLMPVVPFKIKVHPSVFTMGDSATIFPLAAMFDPRELTKMIKESIPNTIEVVDAVNLEEMLVEPTSAVAIFFREKSDTPFAYKSFAYRNRFDFKFYQISAHQVNAARTELKVSQKTTFAVFYRLKGQIKNVVVTEKLSEQLLDSTLSSAKWHSWPELFSDNYYHLCRAEAQLCVLAFGAPDEEIVNYSAKTNKPYQFARVNKELHTFPEQFSYKVVIVNGVTNDMMGFGTSAKAVEFLEKYSVEEEYEKWESGVELQDFLRYRGYTLVKEISSMVFSWGGFGALTLLYISYRILF